MIQTKHYLVLEQFLGDYNREVHGRGLIGKVKLSQKNIALTLDELEKKGILRSRTQGNMKFFRLNVQNTEIKDIIGLTELSRKMEFMQKHRKIADIFREDERIVGFFGTYAKGVPKESSDLDVFIIGTSKIDLYSKSGKAFDLDVSVKFFTEKEFAKLLREKNPLLKEMIQNHILVFGIEKFINLIWRNYYGFA